MVVRGLVRRVVRGVVRRVVRGVGSVGSPRSGGQFFQLSHISHPISRKSVPHMVSSHLQPITTF